MVTEIEDDNEDENQQPSGVVFSLGGGGDESKSKGGKKADKDAPIENALDIPLFEDADKRGVRTAVYIKVTKNDEPNSGYKGNIPLTSTLETIGKLFGNGFYNIEACNHRHQTLRSKENIKIDIPAGRKAAIEDNADSDDKSILSKDIINSVLDRQENLFKKTLELANASSIEAKQQSREYVELVKTTTENAAKRDREFMQGQNKNQQDFFTMFLASQQQMFQQTMLMMDKGHQMTLGILLSSKKNERDPIELLLQGMNIGKDMDGDDTPNYIKVLNTGGDMLDKLLRLKAENPGTQPETKALPGSTSDSREKSNKNLKAGPRTKIPLTLTEVTEVVKLKKILHERGIDLTSLVRQAGKTYTESDESATDGADDDDESSNDNEETTESSSPTSS